MRDNLSKRARSQEKKRGEQLTFPAAGKLPVYQEFNAEWQ